MDIDESRRAVLVGGGGLGPWAWADVVDDLEARGWQTCTPRLPGTADDPTPRSEVDLEAWVASVTAALARSGRESTARPILVVHSFAGYIGAAVLERDPESLGAVVFLDAVIPAPGRSWFETSGPEVEQLMTGMASEGATPWFTREQLDALYPGHGFTDAQLSRVLEHVTPQPIATYRQAPVQRAVDPGRAGVRATYIRCLRTQPPAAEVVRDSPGWELAELDSGHWPMITDPGQTAEVIAASGA